MTLQDYNGYSNDTLIIIVGKDFDKIDGNQTGKITHAQLLNTSSSHIYKMHPSTVQWRTSKANALVKSPQTKCGKRFSQSMDLV